MDTALLLRMYYDQGKELSHNEILELLNSSQIVAELTSSFERKPLYAVWRIIALAEIPFAKELEYTAQLVEYIQNYLSTPYGFTLTGKESDLIPCYNAMLLEAFSKLGYEELEVAQRAVEWIKEYQPFERNVPAYWEGKGVKKYGGCIEATPCFIGVAKAVKALTFYNKAVNNSDNKVAGLIEKGMDYILAHELYKRLSNGQPINKHILNIAFPASYQLNIVELLEITYLTEHIRNSRSKSAIDYIRGKRTKDGFWKTNYIYKADGYISFDKRGKRGDWLTYLLEKYIS